MMVFSLMRHCFTYQAVNYHECCSNFSRQLNHLAFYFVQIPEEIMMKVIATTVMDASSIQKPGENMFLMPALVKFKVTSDHQVFHAENSRGL